ncbi:uncharacterized protein LOC113502098 [Trichoplusia ni]|uniref:Uncharacterized protein LOC113502098 n=1 Tax=Trichoplusia ni TaxID=7111 RepID=A0A7E5WF07_TRINI|nr:uncharacterized protein LOC113502098 [Trichoplusia ni]
MERREQNLRDLLNKVAAEQGFKQYELIINEISSGGANYNSQLFTVILREQNKDDLHLFAKMAIYRKNMKRYRKNVFGVEHYLYTKICETFKVFEEENDLPEEYRLKLAKCYGFYDGENEEILVLDNLFARGYSSFNRFKSIDWEYASAAFTALARFHALSLGYSEVYPEKFKSILAEIHNDQSSLIDTDKFVRSTLKTALKNMQPQYQKSLANYINSFLGQKVILMQPPTFRPVIAHGDFRGNNLLHRVHPVSYTI